MYSTHSHGNNSDYEYHWPDEEEEKEQSGYANNFDNEQSYDYHAQ